MLIGSYSKDHKISHIIEVANLDLQCRSPEKHAEQKQHTPKGECITCLDEWYRSLPWYSAWNARPDEDKALFYLLDTFAEDRDSLMPLPRFSSNAKGYFEDAGAEWYDYVVELYGIEIGEFEDAEKRRENTVYYHILRKSKPNLLILQLRMRICYEPQIARLPIYLEVQHRGWRKFHVSIEGLTSDLDITPADLFPLLRVRDLLFGKLAELPKNLQKRADEFADAARRLGRKRKEFTIPALIEENNKKSRNSYYGLIEAIKKEDKDNEGNAERIESIIKTHYDVGKTEPMIEEEDDKPSVIINGQ